uniref:Putative uridine kinase C227.14 n=1 Tax=Anthurium amnicola TaxID=1678845 RepID=A0A1D1YIV2_9ARAE
MATCRFDMRLLYVRVGWEGLAADSTVSHSALQNRLYVPKGLSTPQSYRHINSYKNQVIIPQTKRMIWPIMCQTRPLDAKRNSKKVLFSYDQAAHVLESRSIEEMYDSLADRLLHNAATMLDPNSKYIVGLAGPPGAGKTTVAFEVVRRLNNLWAKKVPNSRLADIATVIPMDGFHLYRSQLDAMEDPEEAHARRGAPWTFDPVLLLNSLQTLRTQGSVYVPSFDHGVGDPVEEDIFASQDHKVVIVEGNYLFLEEGAWKEVSSIFDEKWFVDVDINTAMQRVIKRHISTGKTQDVAKWRVEYNDRPNAELIIKSKKNADLVIKSVDWTN